MVTGSRIPSADMAKQRAARAPAARAAEVASPVVSIDAFGNFLSSLQAGLRANDHGAVIGLIGYPLRVTDAGGIRTYRSPRDVERDFDDIFTSQVKAAVLSLRSDTLLSRDGGKLAGSRRIWFGPSCTGKPCVPGPIRIREVNP